MSARLGLVGLPNAGKSTLFNALTAAHAAVAPYPFTTTDRNVGVAHVEDERLKRLAKCLSPQRVIPAALECVDIAGLVQGAHQGEGLGNQFLSHVFAVDALVNVVRCFEDSNVGHPMGTVDPVRDVEVIATELLLKDLEVLERRKEKEQKLAKSGDKQAAKLVDHITIWLKALEEAKPIRGLNLEACAQPRSFGIDCLTAKPVLYAANVGEKVDQSSSQALARLKELAESEGAGLVVVCAKLEAELVELDDQDRKAMIKELGIEEFALAQVVRRSYEVLKLITFFTTASNILQAWSVSAGASALQAAGVIHSDFARGFIRAEVTQTDLLLACGSEANVRAQGKLRVEGKDYVVKDGDVIRFRVNP